MCQDEEDEFHKTRGEKSDSYDRLIKVNLPTIEGLALHLDVNRDTIYNWESIYPTFSDILDKLKAKQASMLLRNGLSGDYNPIIAKMILTKHGYTDKIETDITSKGEKISISISEVIAKKNDTDFKPS